MQLASSPRPDQLSQLSIIGVPSTHHTPSSLRTVKVSPGDRWTWLMLDSQGQSQIFGVVKGSSMKIFWVKILTLVVGGSTGTYVVSPP